MASERLPGEEPFHSNTFRTASFPRQKALEKCTSKTGLYNGKSYIKNYNSCDSPRTLQHSYA